MSQWRKPVPGPNIPGGALVIDEQDNDGFTTIQDALDVDEVLRCIEDRNWNNLRTFRECGRLHRGLCLADPILVAYALLRRCNGHRAGADLWYNGQRVARFKRIDIKEEGRNGDVLVAVETNDWVTRCITWFSPVAFLTWTWIAPQLFMRNDQEWRPQ